MLDAANGEATPERLLDCGLYDPAGKSPDIARWLAAEAYAPHAHDPRHDVNRHDERIRAFVLATDAAIPASTLDAFLDLLRSMHGPNLLRVKGVVKLAESPQTPIVVHGVQHVFHPPAWLARWPDADHRTRFVCITRDVDPQTIKKLFDAIVGVTAPDRPDRAALIDNPLVPFGGLDR
jgi:G3E family GTPase